MFFSFLVKLPNFGNQANTFLVILEKSPNGLRLGDVVLCCAYCLHAVMGWLI